MKQTVTLPAYLFPPDMSAPIATVEHWKKALGATVLSGEPLALLRAGGTTFLVPSPAFGVLAKKCALPGEAIEAGEPLAVLAGVSAPLVTTAHERQIPPANPRPGAAAHAVTVADVSEALRFIERTARGETVSGTPESLSLLPFVVSAVAASLVQFPELLVERAEGGEAKRIAVAVQLRDAAGDLWTPVLPDAHRMSVLALAREGTRLQQKVEQGTLNEMDIAGVTFLLSEAPGILYRTPTLHAPFRSHLCFGKVVGEQIHLCLAYDAARVGENTAAAFLSDVADGLASARFLFV